MAAETLKLCMGKGFLLDKEMLDLLSGLTEEGVKEVVDVLANLGIEERVITKALFEKHFEKFKDLLIVNKGVDEIQNLFLGLGFKNNSSNTPLTSLDKKPTPEKNQGIVKLLSAPAFPQKKIEVKDFVNHFRSRFESIKSILEKKEFDNLSALRKIGHEQGTYTIIASVLEKRVTKNKNLLITIEDITGSAIVLVNQNRKEVFDKARDLLMDDIVAFKVSGNKDMLFADDIVFPDTSLPEKKYGEIDEYIAFMGDMHAGSTLFLEKNLLKFVKWLNGEEGDEEQRALASKVKYLFFTGDNVDGVNHYPGQEKYLLEKTTLGQYAVIENIFKLIRKDVQIIMCPGQHDAVWVGEPQPIIPEEAAPGLYNMENVHLVPNPSLVEIDCGFKILMYHGASINALIDEIPEIRTNFGHSAPTRVVKELLKRRHLSPMHGLVDYIPCEKDSLVIDVIPDIIATGDQHRSEVANYNNVLLIAGSCWQSITPFEEKVGNIPDPCKVPLFNLKTREIKVLDFSDGDDEVGIEQLDKESINLYEDELVLEDEDENSS